MKKLVLNYLITGLAGFAFTALPLQAKDKPASKPSTRQLANGQKTVQVAAYSLSALSGDMDSFRNEHPEGGG